MFGAAFHYSGKFVTAIHQFFRVAAVVSNPINGVFFLATLMRNLNLADSNTKNGPGLV
jgi:hypothetical protein